MRQERERLELTQAQFAELGGVKRVSQFLYETEDRLPDLRYFGLLAEHGVDLGFVLFDRRSVATRGPDTIELTSEALWNIFRAVDELDRDSHRDSPTAEERLRFFQILCTTLSRTHHVHDLPDIRERLNRLDQVVRPDSAGTGKTKRRVGGKG